MDEKERLEEIKNNLSIEQIYDLLLSFDANPVVHENFIICRTICHCGNTHKLYYYDNTKLFRCYTECSSSFDIFELIVKVQMQAGYKFALPQALQYVINYFNLSANINESLEDEKKLLDWQIFKKYDKINNISKENQIVEMKIYNDSILKNLPAPRIVPWEKEGISKEICNQYNIRYNPSSQAIVIPHYNIDNELVGIRERTLIKENEIYGKYRPMYLNKQMYNHPLGFNLYNLNNSKENIKKIKKAIIFERRKKLFIICKLFWKRKWYQRSGMWK